MKQQLKKNGSDIIFISRAHKGNLNEYIKNKGIDLVELPIANETTLPMIEEKRGDYKDWLGVSSEQDYTETIKAIGREMKDWLIIDHYAIDHKWEKALRPYAKKIMVNRGFSQEYGARNLSREVRFSLEDPISELLLDHKIVLGDTIKVDSEKGRLKIKFKNGESLKNNSRKSSTLPGMDISKN